MYRIYASDFRYVWRLVDIAYNDKQLSDVLSQLDPKYDTLYMIVRRDLKQGMDEIITIEEVESWKSRKMTL